MRLTAFVSGALFVTICLRMPGASGGGPLQFALLSLVILLPVTSVLVRCSARDSRFIAPLVVTGVVVGIMIDVALDKEDRNLFPIEIVVACALVIPPVIAGAALGKFLKKNAAGARLSENQDNPLQDRRRQ